MRCSPHPAAGWEDGTVTDTPSYATGEDEPLMAVTIRTATRSSALAATSIW